MHYQTEWWNRIKRKVWLGKKTKEIVGCLVCNAHTKEKAVGTNCLEMGIHIIFFDVCWNLKTDRYTYFLSFQAWFLLLEKCFYIIYRDLRGVFCTKNANKCSKIKGCSTLGWGRWFVLFDRKRQNKTFFSNCVDFVGIIW